jgi:hypothetical protein
MRIGLPVSSRKSARARSAASWSALRGITWLLVVIYQGTVP